MIKSITITDYKAIAYLEIRPKALTVLKGRNAVGKSSVLDALDDVFSGGHRPARIRHGAKKAKIEIKLDGGVCIEKTVTPKTTTLKITDETGEEVKSPQAYLARAASGFGFDPLALMTAKPKDRAAFILEASPLSFVRDEIPTVFSAIEGCTNLNATRTAETLADAPGVMDLAGIDALRKSIYDRRTRYNAIAKETAATVANLRRALPADDGDIADWSGHARELDLQESRLKSDLAIEIQAIQHELQRDIDEIRKEAERLIEEQRVSARQREVDARAKAAPVIEAKHAELVIARKNAEDQIRLQALKTQLESERVKCADNTLAAERLSATLEAIDEYKKRKLSESPIEGIEIRDGEVYVSGIPFDECNTATQMLTSFQIAALKQGELGFMIADGVESLDADTFAMFCDAARSSGYQVLAARVEEGLPLTVETCDAT
jgi:hypothetical protein